ncbi:MAG: bifunctional aspartokinase / homoserine dehydrogenase 1 [Thermomicrobiales bacterium]|nr:bifunctional aspartokinase / homoserine dehydrogenase 1 [Thermomicrobiales bacterium]
MIVLKFGGTSVGTVDRVRNAAAIVEAQPSPRAAVVSAASGVTNLLLEAAAKAAAGEQVRAGEIAATIRDKHLGIAAGITDDAERTAALAVLDQLHAALDDALAAVAEIGELSHRDSDRIVATGEKAMSVMMAATLRSRGTPAIYVFADRVIATDDRFGAARPQRERTREQAEAVIRPLLDGGLTVVMTGFIGGAPDGATTTLGRGGSDYSATLLGAALMATEVQIWTDVPGVLSADPRQVSDARVVPQVSFDEAQELAHFGAKVLHPRTIRPAVALDIPVRILSTFAPHEPGTLVTKTSSGEYLKAVTALKGLLLLTIDVPELEDLAGAAAVVFGTLHTDGIEVVSAAQASSRRRMTYLLDALTGGGCPRTRGRIEEALANQDFEATVGCTEDVAVIAAVGQGAAEQPSALGRFLGVLERAGVPVLAANQQMSNVALVAAIPAKHAERAVNAVHTTFIGPQPASARGRRPRRNEMLSESLRVG